jgi:hypothetical protein
MKHLLTIAAMCLVLSAAGQLQQSNTKTERIARTVTFHSLHRTITDGDTAFVIFYKNANYPNIQDFRAITFNSKAETLEFLFALHQVIKTGEHNQDFAYLNRGSLITLINKRSNVLIMPETYAHFWLSLSNVENFINKIAGY